MESEVFGTLRAELSTAFRPAGNASELFGGLHFRTRVASDVSEAPLQLKQ